MIGFVDHSGRALFTIRVGNTSPSSDLNVWIDTGFTGDLVLPQQTIDDLELIASGTVGAILANGQQVALKTYSCVIDWFGKKTQLEVVATIGQWPLLGVGLLLNRSLRVDYRTKLIQLV